MDLPIASTVLGNRILKVDHAGEHGAISIYLAQRWIARWRAPALVAELDEFLAHERRHREILPSKWLGEACGDAAASISAAWEVSLWALSQP